MSVYACSCAPRAAIQSVSAQFTHQEDSLSPLLTYTCVSAQHTAGDQAFLTPRRLSVVNTSSGSRIRDLSFSQAVLSVRLNRQR
jgi:hypothetical protein